MLSPLRSRAGRRLREPFGKAGLTVAVIALVFAMVGGAYAAGKLTSKQKKEVEKIAKKFQGSGPAGAQGPAGAKGDSGAAGAKGDTGSAGTAGSAGAAGTSATTATFAGVKGSCTEGGIEVKSASPTVNVCNGKQGEPWTAGGTLPPGKTETGSWAIIGVLGGGPAQAISPISFTIPLPGELAATSVHYVPNVISATGTGTTTSGSNIIAPYSESTGEFQAEQEISGPGIPPETFIKKVVEEEELILSKNATASAAGVALTAGTSHTGCTGGTISEPKADPGNLCIYGLHSSGLGGGTERFILKPTGTGSGANQNGASLLLADLARTTRATGTWAVTAP